jgi:hypothetical protein
MLPGAQLPGAVSNVKIEFHEGISQKKNAVVKYHNQV